jgi:hypothetical protein
MFPLACAAALISRLLLLRNRLPRPNQPQRNQLQPKPNQSQTNQPQRSRRHPLLL